MEVVFFSDEYNEKIHDILRTDLDKVLYFGSIRMNILMLDTRNVEQTKDVRMYT